MKTFYRWLGVSVTFLKIHIVFRLCRIFDFVGKKGYTYFIHCLWSCCLFYDIDSILLFLYCTNNKKKKLIEQPIVEIRKNVKSLGEKVSDRSTRYLRYNTSKSKYTVLRTVRNNVSRTTYKQGL